MGMLSAEAEQALRGGGWTEAWDRSSKLPVWERALRPGFAAFPAARDVLRRFGGLRLVLEGSGEEVAKVSFDLDPLLAVGEDDRFQPYAHQLQTKLYPLGEAAHGHVLLAVSREGRVYAIMDEIWLVAETIEDAIDSFVRGRRWQALSP